ncbi:MAG: HD-GYP domain-containing protein [Lachnospiraceae bacterium]|nr:HD-GYP domain-containing protein [Lachnospiraceae bacterium]
MRTVSVDDLKSGMITANPILTKRGQEIAAAGTTLTNQLIARLSFYKIEVVDIQEENDTEEPAPVEQPKVEEKPVEAAKPTWISETETHSQKVRKSDEFRTFQIDYGILLGKLKEDFDAFIENKKEIDLDELYEEIGVLYHGKTTIQVFDMIHNIRSVDDSTYAHSVNVALVSRIIGKWLKLSKDDLKVLAVAGLLHDIGKTQIPDEVLNKPGKPTDEEFALIKKHPKMGYDILKKHQVDPRIRKVALMHHERCDGTGYPMELEAEEIDDFASIVAIADVYDAMTAARTYRQPLCPFEVIAAFEKDGLQKYNPGFILTFLERVAATYQNNRIILNDGRSANIVLLNKNHISKPMVQLQDGSCLDLSREPGLFIKSIL